MLKQPTILIVDDHSDIRRLLTVVLAQEFHVLEADSGPSALEAIRQQRPQAVLLDVMMPGEFNGLEVLRRVKTDPDLQHIRVGMATARGQASDSAEASELGADAYFIKPFSPLQVRAWLRSITV